VIKGEKFKELLKSKVLGQGRLQYGEMDSLVKKYHEKGYQELTRDNLNYCLKKLDEEHQKKEPAEKIMQLAAERTIKIWWPPQRFNKAAANQQQLEIQMATADCVENYLERSAGYGSKEDPNGTLESIASKFESDSDLPPNTIRYGIFSGNVNGRNIVLISLVAVARLSEPSSKRLRHHPCQ
jgi:hypothetical protein